MEKYVVKIGLGQRLKIHAAHDAGEAAPALGGAEGRVEIHQLDRQLVFLAQELRDLEGIIAVRQHCSEAHAVQISLAFIGDSLEAQAHTACGVRIGRELARPD